MRFLQKSFVVFLAAMILVTARPWNVLGQEAKSAGGKALPTRDDLSSEMNSSWYDAAREMILEQYFNNDQTENDQGAKDEEVKRNLIGGGIVAFTSILGGLLGVYFGQKAKKCNPKTDPRCSVQSPSS
jgi:hypothetical protein